MEQETKRCPYCGEEILAVAKKCKHCGEWLNNDEEQIEEKVMIPCPVCGELIEEGTIHCPHCKESIVNEETQESGEEENVSISKSENQTRGFFDYYFFEPFVKHYVKFLGRINRKHFWISMLLWCSFTIILCLLAEFTQQGPTFNVVMILLTGWTILSIIPIYAIVLRRMRDGDSELGFWGWWFYILPLPYLIFIAVRESPAWLSVIPFIILLWWLVKPSDNIMRDDGLAPDEEPNVEFMKSDLITVCVIIIIVLGLLISSTIGNSNDDSKTTQIESPVSDTSSHESPENAYLGLLEKYAAAADEAGFGYYCGYFLFDITGDGIPEIWIKSGTCEADYKLSVYTYDNGLSVIEEGEEGDAGHSGYYMGKDYILQVAGHMGYAAWIKLSYKGGKIISENVFEEDLNESGKDDYTEPSEKYIEEHSVDDTLPIKAAFR